MADSILPQPELRTSIEFVQGGGRTLSKGLNNENSASENSARENSARENSARENSASENSSSEILPRENSSREILPREILPRENSSREILPRENSSREILPRENSAGENSSREILPRENSAGENSAGGNLFKEKSPSEILPREKSSGGNLFKEKSPSVNSAGENSASVNSAGENSASVNSGSESIASVNTALRATANIDHPSFPDISNAQLKSLTNGLTVRYVTPSIKDDIMNLRFIKGEKELFDNHLRFNTPFILRFIGGDSIVNSSDKNVLNDAPHEFSQNIVIPETGVLPTSTLPTPETGVLPTSTLPTPETGVLPTSTLPTPGNKPQVPKTNKEKFYDFWEIYINEDGTDGFHRMTGRKANAIKAYLDTIQKAHETYLLKGTLRYLQREENPATFDKMYEKPKDTLFDMFFEVIEVPSDIKKPVEESILEVKPEESKFTKLLQDMKMKESDVKGHFTSIETAYTACMNIIDSNAKEQFNKLGSYVDTVINKHKNEIVKILIDIESIVGESKKTIVELEKKLLDKPDEAVSKELESNKKFIEESNKYVDSIRRYRNAAVLPENIIRAFQAIKPGVRGVLAKRQLFDELKEQYKYAVRLISDPSLSQTRTKVLEEEASDTEEEDETVISETSSLQNVKPLPKQVKVPLSGQVTRSGRLVKPTQPGGRGPGSRKTRKVRRSI